jgi:glycine/D-amino acid oxidase-like deaminating enzyme
MSGVLTAYHILKNATAASNHVKEKGNGEEDGSRKDKLPSVVLLDARQLCSGATGRNGGHVKVKTATLVGLKSEAERNEMQAFVLNVIRDLKDVIDAEDGLAEECEFELRRSFDVFQDADEVAPIKAAYDAAKKSGEAWARERSDVRGERAERVTGIKGAVGAFSVPAASFWPYKFVAGLVERMLERYPEQLNVQTNTPVTYLSTTDDGANILTTPRGVLRAEKVVLATNAWTAGLLTHFRDAITPVKGMACNIKPSYPIHPHLNNTYNIHYAPAEEKGVDYLNPRPDGSLVVGGGSWYFRSQPLLWNGNFDDSVRFPGEVEEHWRDEYMQRTFLGWEDSSASPDSIWVGIMGSTKDGRSWVGRVPENQAKNVRKGEKKKQQWMLAGFNGGGMAQIPRFARAVARMVGEDQEYEDVRREFGLLGGCGTERGMEL